MKFRVILTMFIFVGLVFTLACGGGSSEPKVPTPTPITLEDLSNIPDEQRKAIAIDLISNYITDVSPGKFANSTNVLGVDADQESLEVELNEIETELIATKEFYPAMKVKYVSNVLIVKGSFSAFYYGRPQELFCYFTLMS